MIVLGNGEGQTETGTTIIDEGPIASIFLSLRHAMPVDASRNSRPSRGAPSPTPLHPHPNQVLPAAQVGGGTFIRRDTGQHRCELSGWLVEAGGVGGLV